VAGGDFDGGGAHALGELALGVRRDRFIVLGDQTCRPADRAGRIALSSWFFSISRRQIGPDRRRSAHIHTKDISRLP
jgi:hypothetical protein